MLQEYDYQHPEVVYKENLFAAVLPTTEVRTNSEVETILADLSHDNPWNDRKLAAIKLGIMRSPKALPALLEALPDDPFWMVRCAIIQAVEQIGDPTAIATLHEVVENDGFQVVRSYAEKAIERLSLDTKS